MNDPNRPEVQDLTPPESQSDAAGEEKRDPRDGRTPEDIRNGWSFEDWLAYHQQRTEAAGERIDPHSAMRRAGGRPDRSAGHRWAFPARHAWTIQRRFTR